MLILALALGVVRAEVPIAPSFPECGEPHQPELCPPDLHEDWALISYVPDHAEPSVREAELELGSGISADKAWRTTTGRWDVIVSVGDSGIEWYHQDLRNKVYLNVGELPPPICEDGSEPDDHDCDGNDLTNVEDYAFDPRVSVASGPHGGQDVLDPSDLIYTEWGAEYDGIDNDGNGYIDDIAGWDFFGRDNDAWHDWNTSHGTHGSGVMREVAGEGENLGSPRVGNIGVCPNCAILPVRLGDSFVVDGQRAGEGIVFALDSGAVVMNLAVGALSNPASTTEAAAYAYDAGMVLVGAAGDENAYHHNFPAMLDNVLYVHSIRHDTMDDDDDVYSYMNTWNCNNYGARMTLVAPSGACATGAVAVTTGVVGLVQSAARNEGTSLSAGEVQQLLIQTVDDVYLTDEERNESGAYPSKEGWDAFYGYGRVNAARAVEWVAAGKIPPAVSVDSPSWFAVIDPREGPTVDIEGRIEARAGGFDYVVDYGVGHEPDAWTEIGSGSGDGDFDGVFASLDLADIDRTPIEEASKLETIDGRLERVNGPAVTVRVRVTDEDGNPGELRKTFFVSPDDSLLPGFPIDMGASGESSPILSDLDGDGIYEIIIATADGEVLAMYGDGTPVDGWPVSVDAMEHLHMGSESFASGALDPGTGDSFIATVAVGDLDGDGTLEVVGASGWGGIYAWHADGTRVDGFPTWSIGRGPDEFDRDHTYDQGFAGAPTLADLDGDGALEIVLPGMDGRLYVVDSNGADWGPYPIEICYPGTPERDLEDIMCGIAGDRSITSALVADVDGDGAMEIGIGTNEAVDDGRYSASYLLDAATGENKPGWPRLESGLVNEAALLPLVGQGHPASMAAADMDGDGDLEIVNPVMLGQTDIVHHDGSVYLPISYVEMAWADGHNVDVPSVVQMVNNPGIGDLDGDGLPDPVLGGAGALWVASLAMTKEFDFQHGVLAWSGLTGEMLPGWPRQIEDIQFLVAPAIADVSGDGKNEAIYGSAGYMLYAWDGEGNVAPGWPKFTGHWLLGSPAVGDVTGDGYLDVVVSTREGWLFAWSTDGPADQVVEWASLHHDPRNTGDHSQPIPTQVGPPPEEITPPDKGCGCTVGGSPMGWAWLLAPMALVIGRRRQNR